MMQDVIIICFEIGIYWAKKQHWATLGADATEEVTETVIVTE